LPGGLIGPTLFIGATFGAAYGTLMASGETSTGFYALIGMAAMMSATLNAPLAALTAILELTANPNIILPGMLAIVIANLTTTQLFAQDSIYHLQLKDRGIKYNENPVAQYLRRISINTLLKGPVFTLPPKPYPNEVIALIRDAKQGWLLIKDPESNTYSLTSIEDILANIQIVSRSTEVQIDLLTLPVKKISAAPISLRASLQDALSVIRQQKVDALFAVHNIQTWPTPIHGIVTRSEIEKKFLEQAKNS
jgi:hypothetical protein